MKSNNHKPKNVEENEDYNEPATFLFYVVWHDRLTTFWVYPDADAKQMSSFFN